MADSAAAAAAAATATQALGGLSLNDVKHPYTMHDRVVIAKVLASGTALVGETIVAGGWVKTGRLQSKDTMCFLELNDGSCGANLQVLVTSELYDVKALSSTGTSVLVRGKVVKMPEGKKQVIEVHATEVLFVGPCDAKTYPVAKTKLTLDHLRNLMHLRCRTNTISAITRIRNTLAAATHDFFQSKGFLYLHTPLITSSDCEGAGEMFQLSTLFSQDGIPSDAEIAAADAQVKEQGDKLKSLKEQGAEKDVIKAAVEELNEKKKVVEQLQLRKKSGGMPRTADGKLDYSKDFFGKPAFLTVSGQLEGEIYASAMTSVYTFGPTFRAEKSFTSRHLAEFWMIEPEIAFCDINGNMACAEDYVRFCCARVLERNTDDLKFLEEHYDQCKGSIDRVQNVSSSSFGRISYTDAVELLKKHVAEGKKSFEKQVEWGIDLQSEHERYLAEEIFKKPVVVFNYPKEIKSFYMRLNEDGKTVAAMDVLVPGVGELIGGSQREERFENLEKRIIDCGLDRASYDWYLDLRKYGTVPHSGFGLGFERLILFVTGIGNIRDVIPFPRFAGHIM